MNNKNKKTSNNIFQSSEIIDTVYDAIYDVNDIKVLSCDGVLPFVDHEEGRLLFFTALPSIPINSSKKEKKLNKCMIELRMPASTFKLICEVINFELQSYDKEQQAINKCESKISSQELLMFG